MAASGGHGMLRKSGHNMGKITLYDRTGDAITLDEVERIRI